MGTADAPVLRETDSWVGRELGSFDLTSRCWISHEPEGKARASSTSYNSSLIGAVGEIAVALQVNSLNHYGAAFSEGNVWGTDS